jgi:hypothetical protein
VSHLVLSKKLRFKFTIYFMVTASSPNCHPPASHNQNPKTAIYRTTPSTNCQIIVNRAPFGHRAPHRREHQLHHFSKAMLRPRSSSAGSQIRPYYGILTYVQVCPAISRGVLRGDPTRLLAKICVCATRRVRDGRQRKKIVDSR